jgi:hypothetical protein
MSVEFGQPSDMLASHPETAYFWGHVAGNGTLEDDCVTLQTDDETAARRLAAIAGAEQVDHRIVERDFAHDPTISRTEDEFTVRVAGALADRAGAALGLPVDGQPASGSPKRPSASRSSTMTDGYWTRFEGCSTRFRSPSPSTTSPKRPRAGTGSVSTTTSWPTSASGCTTDPRTRGCSHRNGGGSSSEASNGARV